MLVCGRLTTLASSMLLRCIRTLEMPQCCDFGCTMSTGSNKMSQVCSFDFLETRDAAELGRSQFNAPTSSQTTIPRYAASISQLVSAILQWPISIIYFVHRHASLVYSSRPNEDSDVSGWGGVAQFGRRCRRHRCRVTEGSLCYSTSNY